MFEIVFDRRVPEGRWLLGFAGGLGLFFGLETDEGFALLDKFLGEPIKLVKIFGRVGNFPGFVPEPPDSVCDTINILLLFLRRVRVVVSEISLTGIHSGQRKIETDRLAVSNMQETIWLWWEPSHNLPFRKLQMFLSQRRTILLLRSQRFRVQILNLVVLVLFLCGQKLIPYSRLNNLKHTIFFGDFFLLAINLAASFALLASRRLLHRDL